MNTTIRVKPRKPKLYLVKLILTLGVLSVMVGCASKVTVVADIPTPLVEKVPLNVHLSFTEEFRNHIYEENEKSRALSSLNLAEAQLSMFDAIFSNMTTLVSVDDLTKDLTVEPELLDFQYTAPSETKLKQYEIFLKYRLKLINKDDSTLADWIIKGYGKTPTALLSTATQAFNSAANVALRDIGAQLATRFPGQQKIRALIDSKSLISEASAAKAIGASDTNNQVDTSYQGDIEEGDNE